MSSPTVSAHAFGEVKNKKDDWRCTVPTDMFDSLVLPSDAVPERVSKCRKFSQQVLTRLTAVRMLEFLQQCKEPGDGAKHSEIDKSAVIVHFMARLKRVGEESAVFHRKNNRDSVLSAAVTITAAAWESVQACKTIAEMNWITAFQDYLFDRISTELGTPVADNTELARDEKKEKDEGDEGVADETTLVQEEGENDEFDEKDAEESDENDDVAEEEDQECDENAKDDEEEEEKNDDGCEELRTQA